MHPVSAITSHLTNVEVPQRLSLPSLLSVHLAQGCCLFHGGVGSCSTPPEGPKELGGLESPEPSSRATEEEHGP